MLYLYSFAAAFACITLARDELFNQSALSFTWSVLYLTLSWLQRNVGTPLLILLRRFLCCASQLLHDSPKVYMYTLCYSLESDFLLKRIPNFLHSWEPLVWSVNQGNPFNPWKHHTVLLSQLFPPTSFSTFSVCSRFSSFCMLAWRSSHTPLHG